MTCNLSAAQAQGGINTYSDSNLYTNHFHGYFGNPGTNIEQCTKSHETDAFCVQGDNIFITLLPGQCGEYVMPISNVSSPGVYW